ncbi:MAG: ABC transporter permease [Saprospiraceae bacterium]|nr:ABC transporter permease [Saprospiraceae bacterium]
MIAKIAWLNIWRSRTRSLVVISSIIIGIWSLVFLLAFMNGQVNNYISSIIENETSHIQIHTPQFKEDFEVDQLIPNADQLVAELGKSADIHAATGRILLNGMLSSSAAARGVMVKGIDLRLEQPVSHLQEKIISGQPIGSGRKNEIMLSQRMAEKLKVKLRSKVVLTFQNISSDITTAAFRVVGIYKTTSKRNDELYAFADIADLQRLAEMPQGSAHQIALLVNDFDATDTLAAEISNQHQLLKVETYKEISPDLELFNSQIKLNMIIMTTIFMLALIFGIINTMLMAVLERMKELGMLMAVGMNKLRVFFMVVLETLLIALIGAPIGMLLGYLTTQYLNETGIDLSTWSEALEEFGMANIIRPFVTADTFFIISIAVVITAVLASIYPAFKAIRLKPVQALRKI